jgi:hypothetical protein
LLGLAAQMKVDIAHPSSCRAVLLSLTGIRSTYAPRFPVIDDRPCGSQRRLPDLKNTALSNSDDCSQQRVHALVC